MQRKAFDVNPTIEKQSESQQSYVYYFRNLLEKKLKIERFEVRFSIRFVAKFYACLKLE
jgi:hypothetical protein